MECHCGSAPALGTTVPRSVARGRRTGTSRAGRLGSRGGPRRAARSRDANAEGLARTVYLDRLAPLAAPGTIVDKIFSTRNPAGDAFFSKARVTWMSRSGSAWCCGRHPRGPAGVRLAPLRHGHAPDPVAVLPEDGDGVRPGSTVRRVARSGVDDLISAESADDLGCIGAGERIRAFGADDASSVGCRSSPRRVGRTTSGASFSPAVAGPTTLRRPMTEVVAHGRRSPERAPSRTMPKPSATSSSSRWRARSSCIAPTWRRRSSSRRSRSHHAQTGRSSSPRITPRRTLSPGCSRDGVTTRGSR